MYVTVENTNRNSKLVRGRVGTNSREYTTTNFQGSPRSRRYHMNVHVLRERGIEPSRHSQVSYLQQRTNVTRSIVLLELYRRRAESKITGQLLPRSKSAARSSSETIAGNRSQWQQQTAPLTQLHTAALSSDSTTSFNADGFSSKHTHSTNKSRQYKGILASSSS